MRLTSKKCLYLTVSKRGGKGQIKFEIRPVVTVEDFQKDCLRALHIILSFNDLEWYNCNVKSTLLMPFFLSQPPSHIEGTHVTGTGNWLIMMSPLHTQWHWEQIKSSTLVSVSVSLIG